MTPHIPNSNQNLTVQLVRTIRTYEARERLANAITERFCRGVWSVIEFILVRRCGAGCSYVELLLLSALTDKYCAAEIVFYTVSLKPFSWVYLPDQRKPLRCLLPPTFHTYLVLILCSRSSAPSLLPCRPAAFFGPDSLP